MDQTCHFLSASKLLLCWRFAMGQGQESNTDAHVTIYGEHSCVSVCAVLYFFKIGSPVARAGFEFTV